MARLGRAYPANRVSSGKTGITPTLWLAAGAGTSSTTSPITFTDTIPTGTQLTLIWAEIDASATPTVTARINPSTNATLVSSILYDPIADNGVVNSYLYCFSIASPPTGSQVIRLTSTSLAGADLTTTHYKNLSAVGTPTTLGSQTGQLSMSASSTSASQLYTNAFAFTSPNVGDGFSAYNQAKRFSINTNANAEGLLVGDGYGNGGTLTFSATRSNTTFKWGGMIVPLIR